MIAQISSAFESIFRKTSIDTIGSISRAIFLLSLAALLFVGCNSSRETTRSQPIETNSVGKADFYVATDGNDQWSGKLAQRNEAGNDGPFATLVRARDAVRLIKRKSSKKNLMVLLRGGSYQIAETLVFSLEDSAPEGGSITYAAYPGEAPLISSGIPLRNWKRLETDPATLPAIAQGRIWTIDAPAGVERIRSLYSGLERLTRARTEGFTPPHFVNSSQLPDEFQFSAGKLKNWPDLKEAELLTIPSCDYEMNILPIASVDEQSRKAKTAFLPTRPIGRVKYFDKTLWVENILEALDEPGEWVFNGADRKIYMWPKGDHPGDDIVAPRLTELVRLEGKIDYEGPRDEPVKGLIFRGITFAHTDRYPWHGQTGWSLQHSWEIFDRPSAAVRFRGASECVVQNCRFTATSGTGIRLDLTCQRNRIIGNEFSHIGAVAILLAGYGPGNKDVNNHNEVVNNWVHHTGEIYWASPAIMVWQSGQNRVANNLIHNTPYTGIVVSGRVSIGREVTDGDASSAVRWHELGVLEKPYNWDEWYYYEKFLHARQNLIEKNDIYHVMESMGDGNGIYVSGCGKENHIFENYVHECTGPHMGAGIRCDDFQNETIVEGNVINNINSVQVGIAMCGRNHIINNIIANILPSPRPLRPENIVHGYICVPGLYPYGTNNGTMDITGSRIERNIIYSPRKDYFPILEYGSFSTGPGQRLKGTFCDRNIYWCAEDANWGERYLNQQATHGVEKKSLNADPLFHDLAGGDLRLQSNSPALPLGFKQIDFSSVGLLGSHAYFDGTERRTSKSNGVKSF